MKRPLSQPKTGVVFFLMISIFASNIPPAFADDNLIEDLGKVKEFSIENNKLPDSDSGFVEGEVLVKFKKDKIDVSRFNGRLSLKLFEAAKGLEKENVLDPQNIVLMSSESDETTEELIDRLKKDPKVESVQPNFQYKSLSTTNDVNFSKLWALYNTGQVVNYSPGTNDADIDATEAWDIENANQNDVVVAVIDSGVAYNHPDLKANLVQGYDFVDNDTLPLDDYGHGSHIAGIIAGVANNQKGVSGISKANNVKVMPLLTDLTTEQIVAAINYARSNNAKIINASWGDDYTNYYLDRELYNAIRDFSGIFVAAAGNESVNHDSGNSEDQIYPASFHEDSVLGEGLSNIIVVAATDQNDILSDFSDYGVNSVDVAAPGVNIYSTVPGSGLIFLEDFEIPPPNTPNGWVKEGTPNNWRVVDETTSLGEGWGNVLYGDLSLPYSDNANTTITSPSYDLSNGISYFGFTTICDTADGNDYMALEYSGDGINFIELFRWGYAAQGGYDGEIPSQFLTNNFKFRFRWVTNSADNNYAGCLIDDVFIYRVTDGADESYGYMTGTSMAAPYVSGEAAMIMSYNPSLAIAQVMDIIKNTGDTKPSLVGKISTGKRINLFNALNIFQPSGGFDSANVIPQNQTTQSKTGDGIVTINFRAKDGMAGFPITLKNFEYSVDGGVTFASPTNGDNSLSLSTNWNNNNYVSSTDFAGTVYNFTLNTKHTDLLGLNNVDQNDVVVRFKLNDGAKDSASVTSSQFRVNNAVPISVLTNTPALQTKINSADITVGGLNITTYQYSLDGEPLNTSKTIESHIVLSNLADGTHSLSVIGRDDFGNVQSSPTIYSWLIDSTGPTGTIANASGNPTNDTTPTLNLTIADSGVGVTGAMMRFSCDNATWSPFETFQASKTNFNIKTTAYGCGNTDGIKTVYVQFKDSLENISTSFNTGSFELYTGPARAQFLSAPESPSAEKSPRFTVGGLGIVAYKYRVDNGEFSAESTIETAIQLSNLNDGNHRIEVLGKLTAGTWQETATSFEWFIDTVGPVVTITNNSGSLITTSTPSLALTINDTGVGVTGAMVQFSCDNSTWSDFEAFQAEKNNFNVKSGINGCASADGAKIVYVQGRDYIGNIGASAQTVSFTVDVTAPNIAGLESNSTPVKSKVWTWNSTDNAALFRYLIDQSANGVPTGNYGSETTATKPDGDGTFYLHVQSKDLLGNESAVVTVSAILDNTAPTAVLVNRPSNPTTTKSYSFNIGGDGVTHYKYKIDSGSFVGESPISNSINLDLTDGEHTIEIIGRDVAGNYQTEANSTRFSWRIDPEVDLPIENRSGGGGGGGGGGNKKTSSNKTTTTVTTVKEVDETEPVTLLSSEIASPFLDTNQHWANSFIDELRLKGIVKGKENGKFEPNSNLTRAELVKIVTVLFGVEIKNTDVKPFNDVGVTTWYAPYILAAKEEGIIGGYSDGTFKPDQNVTRVEALKILLEASGKSITGGVMDFKDTTPGKWYEKYVAFAKLKNLVGGYSDGTFKPLSPITRGEMAKIAVMASKID